VREPARPFPIAIRRPVDAPLTGRGDGFGTVVSLGRMIGRVGATGHSTGPHLHFETRLRGAAVRPPLQVSATHCGARGL
jgi:hypothetical protein